MEATLTSHIPAHDFTVTVAPFRAWRSLQLIIARGPIRATTAKARALLSLFRRNASCCRDNVSSPLVTKTKPIDRRAICRARALRHKTFEQLPPRAQQHRTLQLKLTTSLSLHPPADPNNNTLSLFLATQKMHTLELNKQLQNEIR